eukprot:CAMPEP_0119567624 /NCGR_PEP_ID=MMETSP1352-20130426/36453_1 /TAXON_ID=265584 /ORGANISM="Stauroneis constricta, Strain CCMP1120" /LENGTH=48 /DNA_ID= /DNA_START= /DNA_END= /DNA_ORIENTATION=
MTIRLQLFPKNPLMQTGSRWFFGARGVLEEGGVPAVVPLQQEQPPDGS